MGLYLDFDFLNVDHENLALKQGRILISEPLLPDTYFKRSVVLLTEYSDKGAVGFVLNKTIQMPLTELLADFPDFKANIGIGGPVEKDTIHFLHTLGEAIPNSVHVVDDIYWGGDFDDLKEFISLGIVNSSQVRFFLGYSGWSPSQLEDEIKGNAWLVTKIDSSKIMLANKGFWKKTLDKLGEKYKVWSNIPENPTMN
ncbi:MAG: YqgE/AlgH family protein [Bacteroidales bacterium]|jgi:putative transcriptional regulator|nr:YqgE/AlgH family protein [Bacteroidales bacterium]